jgi:RNA polymerase sigma-70 factor (ECF subfamily)
VKATEARLRALMLQGLNGDAAAHGRLLTELAELLRGFYMRRAGAFKSDVEDLVQETLIAVHNRRESYDRSQPFTAWVFAIARYKLVDAYRSRKVRATEALESAEELFAPDATPHVQATVDLDKMLGVLSPQQQMAIRKVKLEGLSVAEAARDSGLSEANIKISIHRGLKRLLDSVRRDGPHAND